jgi:HSP90 family molecular chaperone
MSSIESINSLYTSQTSGVSGSGKVGGMRPPPPPGGMGGMQIDGTKMSNPGEMMSKLQELQEEDPEEFLTVMEQIAEELEAAAAEEEEATGQPSRLSDLAAKFREAAESGDLSVLKPPERPSFAESQDPIMQYQMQEENTRAALLESREDINTRMQEMWSKIFSLVDEAYGAI